MKTMMEFQGTKSNLKTLLNVCNDYYARCIVRKGSEGQYIVCINYDNIIQWFKLKRTLRYMSFESKVIPIFERG